MKINFSDYVIFHWLLTFPEKEAFVHCTYKIVHETEFLLKMRTDSIPNYYSFV